MLGLRGKEAGDVGELPFRRAGRQRSYRDTVMVTTHVFADEAEDGAATDSA